MMKTTSKSICLLFLLLVLFSCKKEQVPGNEKVYETNHETTNQTSEDSQVDCDTFLEQSQVLENEQDLLADASLAIEPEQNKTPSKVNNFEVDPKTEIRSKRDRTSKHYLREDGKTIDAILSPRSVHFKNELGEWEDINTDLIPVEISDYSYANTQNNLKSWFPKDQTKNGVIIKSDNAKLLIGKNFTLSWVNENGNIIKSEKFRSTSPKIKGNTITYNNVYPNIKNEYIIQEDEIKHNFVLEEKPEIPEGTDFLFFGEDVELPEGYRIEFDQNQSGLVVINSKNEIYLEIPAPEVYEEKNEMITAEESYASFDLIKVEGKENKYTIITKISAQWLKERTYPVVIDPTLILNGGSSGYIWQDYYRRYVPSDCSGSTTTSNDYRAYNSTNARIALNRYYSQRDSDYCYRWYHWSAGHYHTYYRSTNYQDYYKGWIKYNTSSIPDVSTISAVEFSGNVSGGYSNNLYTNIYSSNGQGNYTSSTSSAQYNDITYYYHGVATNYNAPGQYPYLSLNASANTRLQALLPNDYFQIGLYSGSSTSSGAQTKTFNTSQSTLRVTYENPCEPIVQEAINPFPSNNATNVCYDGGGAVTALGWTAVPEATLYDVYFGTSATPALFQSNLSTTYTTQNLNLGSNTTYFWRVVPKNDCGTFTNVSTWSFTTSTIPCSDDYCDVTFSDVNPITKVIFGTINNVSSASTSSPPHENFTLFSTTVVEGSTHTLTVDANSGVTGATEERTLYITAFFDWNQNGVLNETGEVFQIGTIYNSTGLDGTNTSFDITLPIGNNVAIGNTTMRVLASRYNYNVNPCTPVPDTNNQTFGQTEDYTVNVCSLPVAICKDIFVSLDETGNANITASDVDDGSTANCGLQTLSISQSSFDCSHVGQQTVDLTITDVFGNSATCQAFVQVTDNLGPEVICQNATVQLDANGTGSITTAAIDNGSTDTCGIQSLSLSQTTFDCSNVGSNIVTLTVTDNNGNESTCLAIVTVEDNELPEIACPGDQEVALDANCGATLPDYTANVATDNCSVTVTQSPAAGTPYNGDQTISVTLTADDGNGNVVDCSFDVHFDDQTAPTVVCNDIEVELDSSGNYTLTQTDIDAIGLGSSDTCGAVTLSIPPTTFTCDDISSGGGGSGELTTESFEDWDDTSYGGVASALLPSGMWESNNALAGTYAHSGAKGIRFNDDSGENEYLLYKGLDGNGKDGGLGDISFWYRHWDGDGSNVEFQVQYNQSGSGWTNISPVINAPNTSWTEFSASPNISGDDILVRVISIDDAERVSFDDFSMSDLSNGSSGVEVTLTVTDSNNNSSTCVATVTVVDNTPPTLDCPNDQTVALDGSCDALMPDYTNGVATDNCGVTVTQSPAAGTTFNGDQVVEVTLTADDGNGNVVACSFNVQFDDQTPPTAVCNDVTVFLDNNGQASITADQIGNTSSDNCGIESMSVSPSTFNCNNVNIVNVWINEFHYDNASGDVGEFVEVAGTSGIDLSGYSLVLYNGNNGESYNTVNLNGSLPDQSNGFGALSFAISGIQNGGPDGMALVEGNTVLEFISYEGSFTATDGLANGMTSTDIGVDEPSNTPIGESLQRTGSGSAGGDFSWAGPTVQSPGTLNTGQNMVAVATVVNTVTLTVTDTNGNVSTCTTNVIVKDVIIPVITTNGDQNLDTDSDICEATFIASATASDNCDVDDPTGVRSDGLALTDLYPVGTTTIAWNTQDVNGNSATEVIQSITVTDNELPTIVCNDITVELDENGTASIVAADIYSAIPTDNCEIASIEIDVDSFDCNDVSTGGAPIFSDDLFISEYIEGSSFNKCIEIYNGTGANVVLSSYSLEFYFNGSTSAGTTINLSGSLADGDVYVVCDNDSAAAFLNVADQTPTSSFFNGDDAVVLKNGSTSIDIFGKIGQDPGSGWNSGSTANHTFVRNSDITDGNTDNASGFPSLGSEWTQFDQDDASHLGSHTVTATSGGSGVTVTLTVTDVNGNENTCTATVTVVDIIAPIFTCPTPNASYTADAGLCSASLDFSVSPTDNCGVQSTVYSVEGSAISYPYAFPVGTTTVDILVTDIHNNTNACSFDVVVNDDDDPVFTCPTPDVSYTADAGLCSASLDFSVIPTDNCEVLSTVYSVNGSAISYPYDFPVGTTTVDILVTDIHNNTNACSFDVVVNDDEDPVFTCPTPNASYTADAGLCSAELDFSVSPTDNCEVLSTVYSVSGSAINYPYDFPVGTTTVDILVTDIHNNTSDCSFDVVVNDDEDPAFTCPTPNASYTADAGLCSASLDFSVSPTDNCDVLSTVYSVNGSAINYPYDFPVGTTTVDILVTDIHNNTNACSFDVTVTDNENPVVTCVDNSTRDTDPGVCDYTVVGNELDATFTDNCTSGSIVNDYNNSASLDGAVFLQGTTVVVWTADDGNDNIVSCTTEITVEDNEAPIVNCLDLQIQLDEFGNGSIDIDDIDGNSTDNCEIASVSLSEMTFDCSDIGGDLDGLIISEYIDGAGDNDCIEIFNGTGNTVNLNGVYRLKVYADGATAATYDVSLLGSIDDRDVYVVCFGSNAGSSQADQISGFAFDGNDAVALVKDGNSVDVIGVIGSNPGSEWASGGVSTAGTTLVRNVDVLQGNINAFVANLATEWTAYSQGTYTNLGDHTIEITELANNVILTVTDTSGNVSTCEGNVTVVDLVPPTPACQNITVSLGVDGTVTVAPSQIDDGTEDNCAIATLELDVTEFDCSNIGVNTVVLTVTDVNGNSADCSATVTIQDTTPPNVVTQDITIQLDGDGLASIVPADVDDGSNDACGIATYTVTPNTFDCSNIGANTVTLTVTDNYGNAASATAVVTVEDMVDPIAVCNAITIYLDPDGTYTLSQTDIDDIADGSTDNCDTDLTYSVSPSSFTCAEEGDNTVTLTVTDDYGNTDTCTTTVTVDGSFPEVTISQSELPEFCQGAAVVLTATSAEAVEYLWNSGEDTASIEVTGNGIYGVLVTSATNCTAYAEFEVTGFDPGALVAAYTILAQEEVFLHGNNLVQTGGVGAMNPNTGNIKLHQATTVVGFGQAPSITLNQGSTIGSQVFAAANPTIPAFVYNTYSNNSSPDATVNNNQTTTLTGSVYDKITVKQNATVIFTQSNVYINELKTFDGASIEFENCANVIINEKFMLAQNGTINNDDPNKVVFYVNEDVQIEKGSNVRASIHAYNHELLVKGLNGNGNNSGDPTYMTGLFIANKVHGNKNVIWNADDLCDPCPITAPLTGGSNNDTSQNLKLQLDIEVEAWPNPSNAHFNLKLKTAIGTQDASIEVFDMNNKLIHSNSFKYNEVYKFGRILDGGVYIVKVRQGGKEKIVRLVRY